MRRELTAVAACCLMAFTTAAFAAAPQVSQLDMNDDRCTIAAAGSDESRQQSAEFVSILDRQVEQTKQWRVFMDSRKWKPGVPIGDQMTPDEANRFGNLQEQTKIGLLTTMLEAKRQRDLRVFLQAASLGQRMAADGYEPADQKSEEYTIALFLVSGRDARFALSEEEGVILQSITGSCNLERAFISEAKRIYKKAAAIPGLDDASTNIDTLAQKYGSPVDREKLSLDDKIIYDRGAQTVRQIKGLMDYYGDLMWLSRLESVSKLQRDVRRWSQYEAPGNPDHISVVWSAWRRDGKITADQDSLSRVMNLLNEKIPTEWATSQTASEKQGD